MRSKYPIPYHTEGYKGTFKHSVGALGVAPDAVEVSGERFGKGDKDKEDPTAIARKRMEKIENKVVAEKATRADDESEDEGGGVQAYDRF
ncbi:hypothetical protein T484DRAFT_1859178 [Baffinella frigidus]|nr:hypothetical protein T484DRAFT_1859178 [Cryptophyta sp. CCMP2293]